MPNYKTEETQMIEKAKEYFLEHSNKKLSERMGTKTSEIMNFYHDTGMINTPADHQIMWSILKKLKTITKSDEEISKEKMEDKKKAKIKMKEELEDRAAEELEKKAKEMLAEAEKKKAELRAKKEAKIKELEEKKARLEAQAEDL